MSTQLRVACAQVDTRVGDLAGNAALVTTWTAKAAEAGAHLVVFPEMTLTGYPAEDLVLRESFAAASERTLVDLARTLQARGLGDLAVVVGYLAHTAGSGPAPVDRLVDELRAAQAELLATVAALGPADLDRTGRHETDGPVTVAGLLRFLPAHQRDHAEQLTALVGR